MRAVDIIIKKRDKKELTKDELIFFVREYAQGNIPDYQASAWAMAVLLNGMTDEETTNLTLAMANSGEVLDLSSAVPYFVDKHSTGGVGDKVSLAVAPIVSALGLAVGKMSGRGLGFSGGTLDKIESIPGYRCDLSPEEFIKQLKDIGIVLTGQSANLAPADGKLYSLRDVTGTVQSLPLIASSVMSKKIAAGANAIVLDVKTGNGAFMETYDGAKKLARLMVSIGKISKRTVVAVISDMNQPLGFAVGNALELKEAIQTLQGKGPEDFTEHCFVIASHMLVLAKKTANLEEAREMVEKSIKDGSAWQKFRQLVIAQGGDIRYADQPEKLPVANLIEQVNAPRSGYLKTVSAREIGETAVTMGAGRSQKSDIIDYAVGIIVHHKVGDFIQKGTPLFTIHANDAIKLAEAKKRLLNNACEWSDAACEPLPLFYETIY